MQKESTKAPKKPFLKKYKNEFKAYLLIGIPLLWWGVFFVFALLRAVYFSFTDLTFSIDRISSFTLDHYRRVFAFGTEQFDELFWSALGVSFIWMFVMMFANNIMGLFVGWLLTTLKRGQRVILGFLFWPSLISSVVSAHIIGLVFSPSYAGLANRILSIFGIAAQGWFEPGSNLALPALMTLPFLLGFSGRLIIYYAAMLGVPNSLYEAAKLETNSKFLAFWYVTLPLIKNAIVLNLVLSLIEGIRILAPMQLVTDGGPDNSTYSIVLYIFNLAFSGRHDSRGHPQMGLASAYAMVVFVIILLMTLIQFKITGKEADNVSAG